jgi:hypothetical protein
VPTLSGKPLHSTDRDAETDGRTRRYGREDGETNISIIFRRETADGDDGRADEKKHDDDDDDDEWFKHLSRSHGMGPHAPERES